MCTLMYIDVGCIFCWWDGAWLCLCCIILIKDNDFIIWFLFSDKKTCLSGSARKAKPLFFLLWNWHSTLFEPFSSYMHITCTLQMPNAECSCVYQNCQNNDADIELKIFNIATLLVLDFTGTISLFNVIVFYFRTFWVWPWTLYFMPLMFYTTLSIQICSYN